jgi:diguanylate cyclase (GGDEF)-like protein/PAS domain S-box-containing protein
MNHRQIVRGHLPEGLELKVLEAAGEGIAIIDGEHPERPVVWVNPAFEEITGFQAAELLGSNPRVLQGGDREQAGITELREAMAAERGCSVLLRNYRPEGSLYWNQLRIEPCRDAQGALWWIGYCRDVSAQREMEIILGRRSDELDVAQRRLEEVDPVDRLTGLQSERSFEVALELAWFSCARDRRSLALFLFAPDYFDVYLETFGRVAGDSCLRMVARGIGAAFRRASDVAARLGEARFAALGTGMEQDVLEPHARRVCDRVRALAIHNPHAPLGRNVTLSAAVLMVRPGRAPDWRCLLDDAQARLTAAQAAGVEQVVVKDYGVD